MDLATMVTAAAPQMGQVQIAMLKQAQDIDGAAANKLIEELPQVGPSNLGTKIDVRA